MGFFFLRRAWVSQGDRARFHGAIMRRLNKSATYPLLSGTASAFSSAFLPLSP
jgi:hypothetical protein